MATQSMYLIRWTEANEMIYYSCNPEYHCGNILAFIKLLKIHKLFSKLDNYFTGNNNYYK